MNGPEHKQIVRLALNALPDSNPFSFKPFHQEVLETCMLPDRVAIELLRGERDKDWGRFFPDQLPQFNFQQPQGNFRDVMPDNRFYLRRILESLNNNNPGEAARQLGIYSHYLADFSQPAHHYELHIGRLLPPPKHMYNCEYHRMIEDIPSDVEELDHRPKLLGASLEELLYRLEGRYAKLYDRSVGALVPMVQAIYDRCNERASSVLNGIVCDSARLLADISYTISELACGDLPAGKGSGLQTCDLRQIPPHDYDAEFNFGHKPLVDRITIRNWGRSQPFTLRFSVSEGGLKPVPGLCAIPHALPLPGVEMRSMMDFSLPEGIFYRFKSVAGLLATHTPQAKCRLSVRTDQSEAFKSPWLEADDQAIEIDIEVCSCEHLRLIAETDGSTDKLAFPIWGFPKLIKRS